MGLGIGDSNGLQSTTQRSIGMKGKKRKSDLVNMAAIVAHAEKRSGIADIRKASAAKSGKRKARKGY